MKWIRCDDCGMSIKVKDDELFVKCPICDKTVNTYTAESVRGFDDIYNSKNYCICDEEEKKEEHVEGFINKLSFFNGDGDEKKASPVIVVIIIIIVIVFSVFLEFLEMVG